MKCIKLFEDFIYEGRYKKPEEEFTQEDYLNWKEYKTKKRKNLDPTQVEKEAFNKYIRQILKGMDPLAKFRKVDFSNKKIEEEQFTEEDHLNYKAYISKKRTNANFTPTKEEREAWNKYQRQKNKGMDPTGPYKTGKTIEEEQFTEEDLFHLREFEKKKRTGQDISEREREAKNKYQRQKNKGMDPIGPYKTTKTIEEEQFTEEDYLNWKEYGRMKSKDPNYIPSEKEREAANKYQRIRRSGTDPLISVRNSALPKRPKKEEEFTEEDLFNVREYQRMRKKVPNYTPRESEREALYKYRRLLKLGMDPIGTLKGPDQPRKGIKEEEFTEEDYQYMRAYGNKKKKDPYYTGTEKEKEAHNKYVRQKMKGIDALALVRRKEQNIKEEEFTEKDYLNYKEYVTNKRKDPNYIGTDEQREAKNKYQRQVRKGMDPIAPFKRGKEEFTEQEPANENILLWSEWLRKSTRL